MAEDPEAFFKDMAGPGPATAPAATKPTARPQPTPATGSEGAQGFFESMLGGFESMLGGGSPAPASSPASADVGAKAVPLKVAPAPEEFPGRFKSRRDPAVSSIPVPQKREGDKPWWAGSPAATRDLQAAINEARTAGINVNVTSGFRSPEKQAALYANRANNPYPVAPPGSSNHEIGAAFDLSGDLKGFMPYARKWGFDQVVADDPIHFTYMPEARGGEKSLGTERGWNDSHPSIIAARNRNNKPGDTRAIMESLGFQHGFDNQGLAILDRQLQQESGYDMKAVSSAGAIGIPQFMPETLKPILNKLGYTNEDYKNNPQVQLACYYDHMGTLLKSNGGNWARSLAAYNGGPGMVDKAVAAAKQGGQPFVPRETQDYVAHILGLGEGEAGRQKAVAMIVRGDGPTVADPQGIGNFSQARRYMHDQTRKLGQVLGVVAPDDQSFVSDAEKRATETRLGDDAKEAVKGFCRAMTCGIPHIAEAEQKAIGAALGRLDAYGEQNGDTGAKVMAGVLHHFVDSSPMNANVPWAALAKSLEPGDRQLAAEEYAKHLRNGQGFLKWAGGVVTGRNAFFDGDAWEANAMSLGMELPSIMGTVVSAGVLGKAFQGAGVATAPANLMGTGSTVATQTLDKALATQFPGIAKWMARELPAALGGGSYGSLVATQTLYGGQMLSQGFGDALHANASFQDAAIEGLTQAAFGTLLGVAAHFGLPLARRGFTAAAEKAVPAMRGAAGMVDPVLTGQVDQASEILRRGMEAIKDPSHPFRLHTRATIASTVKMLDAATNGSLTRAVQMAAQAHQDFVMQGIANRTQQQAIRSFADASQTQGKYAGLLRNWMAGVENAQNNAQRLLQSLDGQHREWQSQNAALLADPAFQDAMRLEAQRVALAEVPKPQEGGSAAGLAQQRRANADALKKAIAKLDPAAQIEVGRGVGLENALNRQSQITADTMSRLTPEKRAAYENDAMVADHFAATCAAASEALKSKAPSLPPMAAEAFPFQASQGSAQQRAIHAAVVADWDASINQMLENNQGLITGIPTQLKNQVATSSRAMIENAGVVGDVGDRVAGVISDLQSEIEKLEARRPSKPAKPYEGRTTLDTPGREQAFRDRQLRYAAELEAWEAEKRGLEQQIGAAREALRYYYPLKEFGDTMAATPSLRVRMQEELARPAFQRLESVLSAAKLGYDDVAGLYAPESMTASEVWDAYRNMANLPRKPELGLGDDVNAFRSELDARAAAEAGKAQRKAVTKRPRWSARDAYQAADVMAAVNDNQEWVRAQIPESWVAGKASVNKQQRLQKDLDAGAGTRNVRDPIVLSGKDGDKGLEVLDGNARLAIQRKQGAPTVEAIMPRAALEALRASKLGEADAVLAQHAGLAEGGASPQAVMHEHIMQQAHEMLSALSPEASQALASAELGAMQQAFRNFTNPSANPTINAILRGFGSPAGTAVDKLPTAFATVLNQIESLKADVMEWLKWRHPAGMAEAMGRSESCLRDWQHVHNLATNIADAISEDFRTKFDAVAPKRDALGRLPQAFGEDLVDAMQSMLTDGGQMQAFLKKYPQMSEPLQAYFGVMSALEKWKVASPDLGALFNQIAVMQRFPAASEYMRRRATGSGAGVNTRLASEDVRKFATLKEARDAYQKAADIILGGDWKAVIGDSKALPAVLLERYRNMDTLQRRTLLPDHYAEAGDAGLERLALHSTLRDAVTDPVVMLRSMIATTIKADGARNMLRHLANIPIPGAANHPTYGRPHMMLEHLPRSGEGGISADADAVKRQLLPGEKPPRDIVNPPNVPVLNLKGRATDTAEQQVASGLDFGQPAGVKPGTKYATMIPLTELGFDAGERIKFAGEDVRVKDLYIHPEVADLMQRYFLHDRIDPGAVSQLNSITRTGALCMAGIPHAVNIGAMHSAAMSALSADAMMASIKKIAGGEFKAGAQGLLRSARDAALAPFAGILHASAGADLSSHLVTMVDATLHGANTSVWNDAVGVAAQQGLKAYYENEFSRPDPKEAGWMERMNRKNTVPGALSDLGKGLEDFRTNWEQQRLAHAMGTTMTDLANAGVTATHALEQYAIFKPIQDAMIGAYVVLTHAHWNEIGPQLIRDGLSPEAAMKVVKSASADQANRISGSLQSYKDPNSVRNFMYGRNGGGVADLSGQFFLSPGWTRTKAHTLAAALPNVAGKEYRPYADFPAMQQYLTSQGAKQIGALLLGGFGGTQLLNQMLNGKWSWQLDPNDRVASAMKVQIGDHLYSTGPWGALNSFVTLGTRVADRDIPQAVLGLMRDLAQPSVKTGIDVLRGEDMQGNPMPMPSGIRLSNPAPSGAPGANGLRLYNESTRDFAQTSIDYGEHVLRNAVDMRPLTGDPRKYQSSVERMLEFGGYTGGRAPSTYSIEQAEHRAQDAPLKIMQTLLARDRSIYLSKETTEAEKEAAYARMERLALDDGIPTNGVESRRIHGDTFRMTGKQLQSFLRSGERREIDYVRAKDIRGLNPEARERVYEKDAQLHP